MINRLKKLSEQLDVIAEVLAIASAEADTEHRRHLLAVIGRASDATRLDLQAAIEEESKRPKLRLIIGGIGIAAPTGAGVFARIRRHPATVAAASTSAAALALMGMVFLGVGDPPLYADQQPSGPASSSRSTPGPVGDAPSAPATPDPSPTTWAPEVPAADIVYSSPVGRLPAAGTAATTPGSPAPSPSGTTPPAPPSTGGPSTSPTWTTTPTAVPTAVPANQTGCLRLVLLSLADADVCLLAAR